jgi:hypothetical protein
MQALCWCAVPLILPKTATTQAKRFAILALHNPQERPNCPTPQAGKTSWATTRVAWSPLRRELFSLLQAAAHHCSICWAPGAPLPHFLVVLQMGPAQQPCHGHAFADSISSSYEHLSEEATRTWRSGAKGVATANIAVTPVRVDREMWVQERVQHRVSAQDSDIQAHPRMRLRQRHPGEGTSATSLAFPPPSRIGSTPRRVGQAEYWLSPGKALRPQSQGFFSGCRHRCVEVPHYLQHCAVGGAYLGRPSWPAATRIALGDQFFQLASLRFSFLFLWLNEKKKKEKKEQARLQYVYSARRYSYSYSYSYS